MPDQRTVAIIQPSLHLAKRDREKPLRLPVRMTLNFRRMIAAAGALFHDRSTIYFNRQPNVERVANAPTRSEEATWKFIMSKFRIYSIRLTRRFLFAGPRTKVSMSRIYLWFNAKYWTTAWLSWKKDYGTEKQALQH